MRKLFVLAGILLSVRAGTLSSGSQIDKHFTNAIGMEFVRIKPGTFTMGQQSGGDFDEQPVHRVNITNSFSMAVTEVTNTQYEQFDPHHSRLRGKLGLSKADDEAVIFVSWYDAVNFCRWLSRKDGRTYRLPTEAGWEYACRAGTTTRFHTGHKLPEQYHRHQKEKNKNGDAVEVSLRVGIAPPNNWGLYDMHGGVEEWCYDWYGPYEAADQNDPVGRQSGIFRVTRGGSHNTKLRYLRSANRMGMLPQDKSCMTGFRVVVGELPKTRALPAVEPPLCMRDVTQNNYDWSKGPDRDKPYFKGPKRFVKIPPGSRGPIFSDHNHCPAVTWCANGDLLAVWFSCDRERGREMSIAGARLRCGSEAWDAASVFLNAPDRNMTGSALLNDGKGTIFFFNGLSADAVYRKNLALIMQTSTDNGATWSRPRLINAERGIPSQPVASAFFTHEGHIVLPSDWPWSRDAGGTAIWISHDRGQTWLICKSPIAGIHAGVVQLKDRRLFALGRLLHRKSTTERMPQSISDCLGSTWTYSQSEFPPIGGGQRPALRKLREGPLFFASFANKATPVTVADASGKKREVNGLFAALSYDQGNNWTDFRPITSTGPRRKGETTNGRKFTLDAFNAEPRGYLACTQTPDGVIHLISSWNHYAFNLKWLQTPPLAE